jgi:hypothetical protein
MEYLSFVLSHHFRLALHSALLFAVGLFVAWPVVRYRLTGVAWLPRRIFRFVVGCIGPHPSLFRIAGVIFLFNATIMLLQMVSGFHSFVPKVLGIWTGMNVAIMTAFSGEAGELVRRAAGKREGWIPPRLLTLACSLMVMALELPCYFYALAMGIRLGHLVQGGDAAYLEALWPRLIGYGVVVAPGLLLSAAAEAVSIRGAAADLPPTEEE